MIHFSVHLEGWQIKGEETQSVLVRCWTVTSLQNSFGTPRQIWNLWNRSQAMCMLCSFIFLFKMKNNRSRLYFSCAKIGNSYFHKIAFIKHDQMEWKYAELNSNRNDLILFLKNREVTFWMNECFVPCVKPSTILTHFLFSFGSFILTKPTKPLLS